MLPLLQGSKAHVCLVATCTVASVAVLLQLVWHLSRSGVRKFLAASTTRAAAESVSAPLLTEDPEVDHSAASGEDDVALDSLYREWQRWEQKFQASNKQHRLHPCSYL